MCATIIALVFAYCSYYVTGISGPFAFVSQAFDEFYGFLTGWSMWIDVFSAAVFVYINFCENAPILLFSILL